MTKTLTILFLFITLYATAQRNHRERIKTLKVSFITERLDLTAKEAEKFWPVYNEYEDKMHTVRAKDIKGIRREIKNNMDTMSQDRAQELITELNKAESTMHELRIGLTKNLSQIISPKKIILLKVAEEDFKRKMLNEFKRRQKERG